MARCRIRMNIIQQLPIEIIESEVLSRLPAKSICHLRCVCKAWNDLLSTPTFARMHLRYQTKFKYLFLLPSREIFITFDCEPVNHASLTIHPIPFKENVFILASLGGLVCVALTKTRRLAFWNPFTGAYKKLTPITPSYDDITNPSTPLAFYTDSCNDYKLLHIHSKGAFVYSRISDSWRKIDMSLEIRRHIPNFTWLLATFVGEKVYFNLESKPILGDRRMISFDVESEEFREIQFPPLPLGCLGASLVTLNGSAHLCVTYGNLVNGLKCDTRKMEGDGWIKVAEYSCPLRNQRKPYRMAHIRRNGNWLAISDKCENIDMEDFCTDLFCIKPLPWPYETAGAIYVETLVSPDHIPN